MTHTPGPWVAVPGRWDIIAPEQSNTGDDLYHVAGCHLNSCAKANQLLISAAPDLLECVRYAVEHLDIGGDVREMFVAALAKAVPSEGADDGR